MTKTGIAVFAYNRPEHLQRVLDGLQKNDLDHLYFFVDGPKDKEDEQKVRSVIDIIENIDWCEKTVHTREQNIGLAESLTSGIDTVLEDYNRIIVLEDDCVPASNFVSYMQSCLDRYEDNEQVMNISGYSPPIKIPDGYPYDVYFTYRSSSWGWGTWSSAWEHFEQDPITLNELESCKAEIKKVTDKAGTDLYPMMHAQLKGDIDSWAVWWSYAITSEDGICVNPVKSKIKNIGHDGSGTHTGSSDKYITDLSKAPIKDMNFPNNPVVNRDINEKYINYIGDSPHPIKKFGRVALEALGLYDLYKQVH